MSAIGSLLHHAQFDEYRSAHSCEFFCFATELKANGNSTQRKKRTHAVLTHEKLNEQQQQKRE